MKQAEVWRDRSSTRPTWCAGIYHYRDRATGLPIHLRPDYMDTVRPFPTHAEALAHALAALNLTEKNGDTP